MTPLFGFELLREETIPELNTVARYYRHVRSGAELLSLSNDDENKVFGITFRTPPPDSTGIAHIMEHSVLGGSRKYKVKEPFVQLIKGSLNTFLNAFTSSDWTAYPVASQNLQDFYNLIDVYLDAVFYPLITSHHLDQEGWHFELEEIDAPLTYKGVVFNEMKGAYSSPDDIFGRQNQRSLFVNHVYGLDSGGDPQIIPNLTYEQFSEFHQTLYHPANARIFFYGDDDPQERLRLLDGYLQGFEAIEVDSVIELAPRYSEPEHFTYPYVVDSDSDREDKGRVQVNWLLPENSDPALTMGLTILSYALVSTPASPLRKALIDSGLGEEITGGGLSTSLRELTFGIGLKGIAVDDSGKVEDIILDTLGDIARDGLEAEMIEAAVNSIEFQLRENNTGRFPRGLSLMLQAMGTWLHGGDPLAMLAYEAPLQAVKAQLKNDPEYFQTLIKTNLLDNSHRTTVTLIPDRELGQKLVTDEETRLATIRSQMDDAQLQGIISNTKELKLWQETPDKPEELAAIPTLTLGDLDRENKRIPIAIESVQGAELLYHDLFTNGILYIDVGFDLHALPAELLPYVNLFGSSLTKMGTESEGYVRLSQRINSKTGGIWHQIHASMRSNSNDASTWLFLRGKSTVGQTGDMLDIFRDVLLTAKLDDRERFRQLTLEAKAGMEAGLARMGHLVVRNRLSSQFNEADWASEQMNGISYLFFLTQLLEEIENDWSSVHQKLETVRQSLINRNAMVLNVTLDADNYDLSKPQLLEFVSALPAASTTLSPWSPALRLRDEGLTIPARVNYVGKGANIYNLGYQFDGSSAVISKYLRTTWLWEKVRVQGGAYGGMCSFDQFSGVFSYMSYRDPNLIETLKNYDNTANFLLDLEISDEELEKSIIGTVGDIDGYQLPDAKGFTSMERHLVGLSEQSRQEYRNQILSTTAADFKEFGQVLAEIITNGRVVVLGSSDAIQAANEGEWMEVHRVL